MRRWLHKNEDRDIDDRYLTEDQVERLAGELLERAYELAAADPPPRGPSSRSRQISGSCWVRGTSSGGMSDPTHAGATTSVRTG